METNASAPHGVRLRCLLILLILVATGSVVFWAAVQRQLAIQLLLRAEVPSESVFADLLTQTENPGPLLEQVWKTGRIPHRQLVASYLKDLSTKQTHFTELCQAILVAAAGDADASVRELALSALALQKNPRVFQLAREQLRDADPQIRLLGMQYLARADAKDALPVMIKSLDDADLRVVTTAGSALRRWTGNDYGIRIFQSVPKIEESGDGTLDPANIAAIDKGVRRWKEWWKTHEPDYHSAGEAISALQIEPQSRFCAADFELRDLNGKLVRLSDFRGKVVLLNFWATWCTACLAEIPELIELQQKYSSRIIVCGISLDGVSDSHGHSDATMGSADEGRGEAAEKKPNRNKIRAKVERIAKAKGIKYPVLLDPDNTLGARFNGGELPTNILIDPQGQVRRRFIGARSPAVLHARIAEIAGASGGAPN
jgi:thiol-disulfide isomerase/thioredoxin